MVRPVWAGGASGREAPWHGCVGEQVWKTQNTHTHVHTHFSKIPSYLVQKKSGVLRWRVLKDRRFSPCRSSGGPSRKVCLFFSSVQDHHFIDVDDEQCDRPCLGQVPKINPCPSVVFLDGGG